MNVKQNKPVFLDLTKIRFPIPAIVSILHRISGFIIFLLIPLILWMAYAASTASGFAQLQECFSSPIMKIVVWAFLAFLIYHFLAGVKHLLMDGHILSENLTVAKIASTIVIVSAVVLIILAGVWIW